MNIYLSTLGCRLNEAELENWARQFSKSGHDIVHKIELADLIVINTCTVTQEAAHKSRKLIRRLRRQNPNARLVLTGCFSEIDPQTATKLAEVDLVVPNQAKDRLLDILQKEIKLPIVSSDHTDAFLSSKTRAFVKVQDGCRHRCAYCIVSIARGPERSLPINAIVDQVNTLCEYGYKEIVLTGVHLGGYGNDLGTDLFTLVKTLLNKTTIPRLRLSSLEPWGLPPHFWELWQNTRLCPHIHLPLQSGCDSVLRRMGRRCTTDEYFYLVEKARKSVVDLSITTDLMVGFPGETNEEWEDSIAFVQQISFAHVHVFVYSPRQGTAAFDFKPQIPFSIKKERSKQMHKISNIMREQHLRRFLGQQRSVLWEGNKKYCADKTARWTGLTDNYLKTETFVSTKYDLKNKITKTYLKEINKNIFQGKIEPNII